MNIEKNSLNRYWSDLEKERIPIGIFISSLVSALFFTPLNVILTYKRLDHDKDSYRKIIKIIKKKYGYKGLYRGFTVSFLGGFILDEVFIPTMEYSREYLNIENKIVKDYVAGLISHSVITPLYTIYHLLGAKQMGANMKNTDSYQNVYQTTKLIVKRDGFRGLFKGISLEVMYIPIYALWWNIYYRYKECIYYGYRKWCNINNKNNKNILLSTNDNIIINGFAGGLAGCSIVPLLNPIDTVSTQLQAYSKKHKIRNLVKNIYTNKGIKGFYSGLSLNFFEMFTQYTFYASTYEGIKLFCSK